MTTICASFAHRMMAGDSLVSLGDLCYPTTKLLRKGAAIIGAAGESGDCLAVIQWWGAKKTPKPKLTETDSFEALILMSSGLYFMGGRLMPELIKDGCFAIGSGAQGAMVAMRHYKANPREAVEAVCGIDRNTGLPVDFLTLKGAK